MKSWITHVTYETLISDLSGATMAAAGYTTLAYIPYNLTSNTSPKFNIYHEYCSFVSENAAINHIKNLIEQFIIDKRFYNSISFEPVLKALLASNHIKEAILLINEFSSAHRNVDIPHNNPTKISIKIIESEFLGSAFD